MVTLERIEMDELTVVKLKGSLTNEGLEQVERSFEAVTGRPGARTVVDLTGVEMVTTPALSMFIAAANQAKSTGGRIIFTETRPPVRDVLKRLRLHSILETVPGLEHAIDAAR